MLTRKRFILAIALTSFLVLLYKQISLVDRIKKYTSKESSEKMARYVYSTDHPHSENMNQELTTESNRLDIILKPDFKKEMQKFNMSSSLTDKIFELYKEVRLSSEQQKKQLQDFLYAMNIVDRLGTTDSQWNRDEPQKRDLETNGQSKDHNKNLLRDLQNNAKSIMNENLLKENRLYQTSTQRTNNKPSLKSSKTNTEGSEQKIFKTDNSLLTTGNNATKEVEKIGNNDKYKSWKKSYGSEVKHDFAENFKKKILMKFGKPLLAKLPTGKNRVGDLRNQVMNSNLNINRETEQVSTEPSRPDTCEHCFNGSFKMIINHSQYCKRFTDMNLIILISSAPYDENARMIVRYTWATLCTRKSQIGFLFVLGKTKDKNLMEKVKEENSVYHDILQFSFFDAYTNLTYKTLSGIRWADQFCNNSKFIMKMDTDVYLNTELLPLLLQALPRKNFLGGYCWGNSDPQRDVSSKWYVSFRSYRGRFPPMCSGTGYILSQNLLPKLLNVSSNIPFFHLEDVYVAICMQKLGITPVNINGFNNMMRSFEACEYRNEVLTSHLTTNDQLSSFWNSSRKCERTELSPSDVYKPIPLPYM